MEVKSYSYNLICVCVLEKHCLKLVVLISHKEIYILTYFSHHTHIVFFSVKTCYTLRLCVRAQRNARIVGKIDVHFIREGGHEI